MAPSGRSFVLECDVPVDGNLRVRKYRSNVSGISVCLANVEGPLVSGHFCLATEAHDDDGLPHTLEHLVFMGSEKYPYKVGSLADIVLLVFVSCFFYAFFFFRLRAFVEVCKLCQIILPPSPSPPLRRIYSDISILLQGVLDMLANRCLAQGTNAWTDTDHTCYTISTAGSQGFLNLLPIYLDHILYPTLTEASYLTEVHHVNGDGDDAGVVYCEMQARENTRESRSRRALLQSIYPGKCGYKSVTGGMLENLRTSTSHVKVCDYHRQFYRPDNLCLIITGQVEPAKVFQAMDGIERKFQRNDPMPAHVRPWLSPVPEFVASLQKLVLYPSDDESTGIVTLCWRGPMAKELFEMTAIGTLMEYLTDTPISPLQRELVEIAEPFCNKVKWSVQENSVGCVLIKSCNVPFQKLHDVRAKVFDTLERISNGTDVLDMQRMQTVIHRQILETRNHMEEHPHKSVAFHCIGHFLYGDQEEEVSKAYIIFLNEY
uniref:Peptidase M16 C-terminal domain-containing protein n=1 Tax=Eptatretus burgeri TaxID=7764 RepID=A0A8C4QG71_EPTBU